MKVQDVTDTLDLALAASGCDQARVVCNCPANEVFPLGIISIAPPELKPTSLFAKYTLAWVVPGLFGLSETMGPDIVSLPR